MKNKVYKVLLLILVLVFIYINYNSMDSFVVKNIEDREEIFVSRIIDGDTLVDNNKVHYRLLGINTPEKGEYLSDKARKFLEARALNKTLEVESKGKDLYNRELVYLFEPGSDKSINLEIIENGFGNYYFPEGKENYYNEFIEAWNRCIVSNVNLCEKSKNICASCIELKQFEYGKDVILYNSCNFECNITKWSVKDEGRKTFVFDSTILESYEEVRISNKDFGEEYVWTKTGDTLFLRDAGGLLVLWEGY